MLSLFEWMSSRGLSCMSLMEWPGRVWSETAVGWSMWGWVMAFSIARLCSPNLSLSCCLVYCTLHLEHCIIYMRFEDEQEMWFRICLCSYSREEGVKRGFLCNKRTCFALTSVTAESSRFFGGVVCGVWLWLECHVGCCIGGMMWEEEKGMPLCTAVKNEECSDCWKWFDVC